MTFARPIALSTSATSAACAACALTWLCISLSPGCSKQVATNEAPGAGDASPDVTDGGAADAASSLLPALPLHTQSRWIMDAKGARFKLAGVSWYGGESSYLVPMGLDRADVHAIAHATKLLGFNSVRLPWANQLFEQNPVVADALVSANPSLQGGKHALDVFDAVIDAIASEGMVVILDNHRSRGDWCCDTAHGDGLWHTVAYPAASWLADWQGMVQRYRNQPAVVGVDLRNELRGQLPDDAGGSCQDCDTPADAGCGCWQPSWGDNSALTDWALAAESAGNSLLALNPDLLVIVEGDFYATYFGASNRPVHLNVANRLVYSPHNYAGSNGGAASFGTYAGFKTAMDQSWGYLVTEGQTYTAPVWVGEFGANNSSPNTSEADLDAATPASAAWWVWIRQYIAEKDLDWSVWALNGTQGPGYGRTYGAQETFGVLGTDWRSPAPQPFIAALQALQPATLGPDAGP